MNKFRKLLRGSVGVLVVLLGISFYAISVPASRDAEQKTFTILPKEGGARIAKNLQREGLISSPTLFKAYAFLSGKSDNIMAGQYKLSSGMSIKEILSNLTSGKAQADTNIVRLKEGWTNEDIAKYLDENNIVSAKEFNAALKKTSTSFLYFGEKPKVKSLEGYLFPDTYFFAKNTSAEKIIQRLVDTLDLKLTAQIVSEIKAQDKTIYDILTLASIVEKEVGRNKNVLSREDVSNLQVEREIVAGIFYNRLAIGMALQSDATVTYITKKRNPQASIADTQIDSPYNTYKYKGLPPGPISNPSLSSILAVVRFRDTDYLYFLTKEDGTAVFAKTFEEHSRNKAEYLD